MMKMELRKTEEELTEENTRLKKKINGLIDLVEQLSEKPENQDIKEESGQREKNQDLLNILSQMCREMDMKKLAISGRRTSKNKDFIKIKESDFEQLFQEDIRAEIYDFLAAMGILKSQVSGKISWSDSVDGESVRIVLFRKSAFRYLLNTF